MCLNSILPPETANDWARRLHGPMRISRKTTNAKDLPDAASAGSRRAGIALVLGAYLQTRTYTWATPG